MLEEFSDEEETFDLSNVPPYYAQKLNGFLREACKQGHLTCVDVLVSKGADVNYVDKRDKTTVLHEAIFHGHTNIIEYLYNQANEKTRQSARTFALDKFKKLEDALKVFKYLPSKDPEANTREDGNVNEAGTNGKEDEGKGKGHIDGRTSPSKYTVREVSPLPSNGEIYSISNEKYNNLKNNYNELKRDFSDLHKDYNGLQKDYDELQKKYELYKKESEEMVKQLNTQVERLNNELALEKEHNQETEDVLDSLGKELSQKMREITSVKTERDTERRAKEIARKILSLDDLNMPIVKRNPLLDLPEMPKTENARNSIDFSNFDIQGKGNRPPTTLIPNRVKQEGSRDDMENHIEDRVKYRVRRLVRRWEEMTDV